MNASSRLEKAVEENKLAQFLRGLEGYSFVCQYADVPTNTPEVFSAISNYHDHGIRKKFVDELIDLSRDSLYSWLVPYYLYDLLAYTIREKKKWGYDIPFELLVSNLKSTKKDLEKNKSWIGKEWGNGLWGDVERLTKIINEKFDMNFELNG